jgi:hypothetical protein
MFELGDFFLRALQTGSPGIGPQLVQQCPTGFMCDILEERFRR